MGFGSVIPVLAIFDVPEAVDFSSVVVGFLVANFDEGFATVADGVGDCDEEVVRRRIETVGGSERLCFRFFGDDNHWSFDFRPFYDNHSL